MSGRSEIGQRGEEVALAYLLKQGLLLMERNWRSRHREVDLIMLGDDGVHIVEVRSLSAPVLHSPADTVSVKKQRLLIKAATSFIAQRKIDLEVHFDVVSIIFRGEKAGVEYIPDAFLPFMDVRY